MQIWVEDAQFREASNDDANWMDDEMHICRSRPKGTAGVLHEVVEKCADRRYIMWASARLRERAVDPYFV
jgi:hypothetical protein